MLSTSEHSIISQLHVASMYLYSCVRHIITKQAENMATKGMLNAMKLCGVVGVVLA